MRFPVAKHWVVVCVGLWLIVIAGDVPAQDEPVLIDPDAQNVNDADGVVVASQGLVAPSAENAAGTGRLFDIELFPAERERYGDRLDPALDAYRRRAFIEMQDRLTELFVTDPDARLDELPRLLEAEAFYFNGADAESTDLRVRFAKRAYQELLTRYPLSPRNDWKLFRLGSIMVQQQYYPEAAGTFSLLVEDYPDSEVCRGAYLLLAENEMSTDHYALAVEYFHRVTDDPTADDDELFAAFSGLAISYEHAGDLERARKIFDDIAPTPQDVLRFNDRSLFVYGDLLSKDGKTDRALTVFSDLIERFPESPYRTRAMVRAGELMIQQGNRPEGLRILRTVYNRTPRTDAELEAGVLLAEGLSSVEPFVWNDEAWSEFRKVRDNVLYTQLSMRAQFGLARMLLAGEREREAIVELADLWARPLNDRQRADCLDLFHAVFERYVAKATDRKLYGEISATFYEYVDLAFRSRPSVATFERVTDAYYENHLFDSLYTIGASVAAQRLFPVHAELVRARAEIGRGHLDEARKILNELVSLDPSGVVGRQAAIEKTRIEFHAQRYLAAIESADKALALPHTPVDRADLMVMRSLARLENGDWLTSAEGFRQSIDLLLPARERREKELLADALYGLGRALVESDQPTRAKPVLEAALGAFPQDGRAGLATFYLSRIPGGEDVPPPSDAYWKSLLDQMKTVDAWTKAHRARLNPEKDS